MFHSINCLAACAQWPVTRALIILVVCSTGMTPVFGQAQESARTVEEATPEQPRRPLLDLGSFRIREHRPLRNETFYIAFDLRVELQSDLTQAQVDQLQRWTHRLRDQVIIGVRLTDPAAFKDPDLERFRRQLVRRINRVIKHPLATDVLLANLTFSQS